ncbi:MAG: Nramp family divalent metal transporter [Patescibacteria group bacterium]
MKNIFKKLGPGLITGASDDDPSGILVYLQAGVILGFKTLWTALFTIPLMYAVQEMCGRIGLVTGKGLMRLIKENYPRTVLYFIAAISIGVIVVNIGADLLAVGAILEHLTRISRLVWLPLAAAVILVLTVFLSYHRFVQLMKWLLLSLVFYVVAVVYIGADWSAALRATFLPSLTWSKESALYIAAILGATISPYLFFWQANEEIEEEKEVMAEKHLQQFTVTKHELKLLKEDTFVGMLSSNVITWFIIVGGSQLALFYGVREISSFDQAAEVLQPVLGNFAYLVFALGLIGTGFLAIPILAGSVGYGLAEIFNWQEGINLPFRKARGFYLAIIAATISGMLITLAGIDPIKLLIYTAVLYTIITPPLIWIILRLSNNPNIMGASRNGLLSNFLGYLTLGVTTLAAAAYLISLL